MKSSNSFAPLLTRPCLRDEIERELATRQLREFVRQAWPIIEPSTPFVPGWHIYAIIEHLEAISRGQIRKLLINVPPRHMKRLLVSVFWPAWEWIRWPDRRWLFASYAESLAIRDNVRSRRLIQSAWYQNNWGATASSSLGTKMKSARSRQIGPAIESQSARAVRPPVKGVTAW